MFVISLSPVVRSNQTESKMKIFFLAILCAAAHTFGQADDFADNDRPNYKYSQIANENGTVNSRPKRFVYFLCMNFPDCCDFRGKDVCGYPCPLCPKKEVPVPLTGCKFIFIQLGIANLSVSQPFKFCRAPDRKMTGKPLTFD